MLGSQESPTWLEGAASARQIALPGSSLQRCPHGRPAWQTVSQAPSILAAQPAKGPNGPTAAAQVPPAPPLAPPVPAWPPAPAWPPPAPPAGGVTPFL